MKGTQISAMQPLERRITLAGKQARYYCFSGLSDLTDVKTSSEDENHSKSEKPVAHFYGGNGFPVGVYEPLINELSQQFEVISLAMRGYWYDLPRYKVLTREQDAELLIEFLEKTQDKPVIGIGHSQGATATAMAAAKRPDLFAALYLIDPVTFTKKQTLLYSRIPHRILMTQEPFKSTRTKQEDWESIEDYYRYLRQHRAFKRISDEHLKVFAQNSLVPKADGSYTLLFKPEQELASYFGTPYITDALKKLNKKQVPYWLIMAKPSVFNSEKVRQSWQGIVDPERILTLNDYGHLIPMEAPEKCADIIAKLEATKLAIAKLEIDKLKATL